jgi:hypothetical protein
MTPDTGETPPLFSDWIVDGETFSFFAFEWNVKTAKEILADLVRSGKPRESHWIEVPDLKGIVRMMDINPDKVARADTAVPLIVVKSYNWWLPIDGWHRIAKATSQAWLSRVPSGSPAPSPKNSPTPSCGPQGTPPGKGSTGDCLNRQKPGRRRLLALEPVWKQENESHYAQLEFRVASRCCNSATPAGEVRPILQRFGYGATVVRLAGAQPGKSVGAPFLAANAMMDSEKALGIVFLLHGGQPGIV